jgi:hypothetical protein
MSNNKFEYKFNMSARHFQNFLVYSAVIRELL